MRVPNDPVSSPGGAFAELLRLQGEFQARLGEETLRYLRRLQGAFAPATPGTVVVADPGFELVGKGVPGQVTEMTLEVENRQRVHCVVTPTMTSLVAPSGTAWFPSADFSPISALLGPGDIGGLKVQLAVPEELPSGVYRGALILQGFRKAGVPVTITVGAARTSTRARKRR
jgi:hypothetical protein